MITTSNPNINPTSPNINPNCASMINNSVLFDNQMYSQNTTTGSIKRNNECYFPKPIYKWVSDSAVTHCYNCKELFTLILRKHHCRVCGRIFCSYCSNNFREIPHNISKPLKISCLSDTFKNYVGDSVDKYIYDKKERICDTCLKIIDKYNVMDQIFLNAFRFLDLDDVRNFMLVSKSFYRIVMEYQTKFRGIQYKFFTQRLSDFEYDLLLANKKYFAGHSRWIFHLIQTEYPNIISIITQPKTTSCTKILCKTGCKNYLETGEILQLLFSNTSIPFILKEHLIMQLHNIYDTELICCIPIFVELIAKNDVEIINFVIDKFTNNKEFYHALLWELVRNNISLPKQYLTIMKDYQKYKNVFYSLQNLNYYTSTTYTADVKSCFDTIKDLTMLGEMRKFCGIQYEAIKLLKSKTQPIIIPFIIKDANHKYIIKKYIFKKDNIYQDYIVTKVIKLMIHLLKIDKIITNNYINYDIILLTPTSGFVEFVEDAETLYNLIEEDKDILNYVLHNNKDLTVNSVIEKLTESLAVYSIISYLLGIGDRHLNNIMVHKSGAIFHIDFGFILGNDPKFNTNHIRLSMDMIKAIGGRTSDNYNIFKIKCSTIFNCLRKHIGIISLLLNMLTINHNSEITTEKLTNEIMDRFEPGEKILDASDHIKTIVDNSHDNITSSITDTFYKLANVFR